jgi:hypothetical protein
MLVPKSRVPSGQAAWYLDLKAVSTVPGLIVWSLDKQHIEAVDLFRWKEKEYYTHHLALSSS